MDSSVGGKTAVDLCGIKNIVGAFYQPKAVIIDPLVLKTLDARQFSCGAAEIIKMAACFDRELFETIEKNRIEDDPEMFIAGALNIKKDVVQKDERESGLRRGSQFRPYFRSRNREQYGPSSRRMCLHRNDTYVFGKDTRKNESRSPKGGAACKPV